MISNNNNNEEEEEEEFLRRKAKELDCDHKVSEFELQSRYYVHFRTYTHDKYIKPLIPQDVS